jgi:hypothetical protein
MGAARVGGSRLVDIKASRQEILMDADLEQLTTGQLVSFASWPPSNLPAIAAGVYTIWDKSRFIYVGMSGRGLSSETLKPALFTTQAIKST